MNFLSPESKIFDAIDKLLMGEILHAIGVELLELRQAVREHGLHPPKVICT